MINPDKIAQAIDVYRKTAHSDTEREIAEEAYKAVLKQVPLPVSDDCCPMCEKYILIDLMDEFYFHVSHKPKFCHYCGQALDWSKA